jgi:predicted dehydrogenase
MKDQKKIRLGLIGVGNWALFGHVRVLRLSPNPKVSVRRDQPGRTRFGAGAVFKPVLMMAG